jgi:hypothetical protein
VFPSSSGLGHLPFTEDTGVRIPLGTPNLFEIHQYQVLSVLIMVYSTQDQVVFDTPNPEKIAREAGLISESVTIHVD